MTTDLSREDQPQSDFKSIFEEFILSKKQLKVVNVASCSKNCIPNSASKMLVDVIEPNRLYFLDYRFTQTFSNIHENPVVSVSFLDDDNFTGYRMTGSCQMLTAGEEFEAAQKSWEKKLISYEADRILKRMTGRYSARDAENHLPKDFIVMKVLAKEASTIKPDRVLRAFNDEHKS